MPRVVWNRGPSKARPKTCRALQSGDAIPTTEPRRYVVRGYVILRWRVAPQTYVEVREHRVRDGRVVDAPAVHHLNHIKHDNRPANLLLVTNEQHGHIHNQPTFDLEEARRLYEAGYSTVEIGRMLGVDHSNVWRRFQVHGIPTRRLGELTPIGRERLAAAIQRAWDEAPSERRETVASKSREAWARLTPEQREARNRAISEGKRRAKAERAA